MIDFAAMPSSNVHVVTLTRHPQSGSEAARRVSVRVRRDPGGSLALTYLIDGDLARLRLPPPRLSRVADGLWQHTCCECFLAVQGVRGYH